ncbi:alpha-mannosidase [Halothermothrix orenii H 168]|uniref:Alpha-mannosidase n=2 Tax=Halothermothrix orenii TaxID=31909 RepID=B8CY81_HALOH|nr:alpha-mannosidase [Halothermothrix orenii H 168]
MLSLYYDLKAIYDAAYAESMDESIKNYLQYHLQQLIKEFPLYGCSREEMVMAIPKIKEYINNKIYKGHEHFGKNGKIALVAHSHLDVAYHWTAKQAIQKNARTTLIQLRLMEEYPDFKYAHSQAWTYEKLEKYYPELFAQVKERIKSGQWEIVGGMYIEPDCNLISAESFVRQIVYGKYYFKQKFGIDVDNCWLPDVFGNSPIMPQILKSGGLEYFVTHKLSVWNDTNKFPHNVFLWKGLDGTTVNACIPPIHFVTWMDTEETINNWNQFQDKNVCDETLQLYGYGDGGSGVTDEMLQLYERQQKLPGIPEQRLTTAKEYLHRIFKDTKDFAVWDGDLYLEMHRGTYTSKAKLKKYNRQGEFLAQEVETLCTACDIYTGDFKVQNKLKNIWKKLLVNQFHDILPGSHTQPVYKEAIENYEEMFTAFNNLKEKALKKITSPGDEIDYVAFNAFSDVRNKVAYIDANNWDIKYNALKDDEGNIYPVQKQIKADGSIQYAVKIPDIPGFSLKQFKATSTDKISSSMKVSQTEMENDYYILKLESSGKIVSLYDKVREKYVNTRNEVLNKWQMFEDKPGALNAWDIVETYKNQEINLPDWENITVIEDGPVSIALRMERKFSNSKAVQVIRMFDNKPQIDFDTWVDWQEEEKLLKVAFPVNVRSRTYSTDTSAGGFERMNHKNTGWEQGQFEVPCHKWVDISEGLFGVSLMNDCKYGCDVEDNVMRLTLLKAPIYPDRTSDREEHTFTYSIFTHDGNRQTGGLEEAAYDLNYPLILEQERRLKVKKPVLTINVKSLKCQAFKLAEDGSSDIILRLAEVYGSHGKAKVHFNFNIEGVSVCNILEEEQTSLQVNDNTVTMDFSPYQIISLRVKRKL